METKLQIVYPCDAVYYQGILYLLNILRHETNKMHTFLINVLIQFLLSSTCFEHHVFIIRKSNCTCSFYGMFFMRLCEQSGRWKDVLDIEHILPPARLLT